MRVSTPAACLRAAGVARRGTQVGRGRVSLLKTPPGPEGSSAHVSPARMRLPALPRLPSSAHMPRAAFPGQRPQTPAPLCVSNSLLLPEWSLACPRGRIPEQVCPTACSPVHLGIPPRCPPCPAQSRAEAPRVNCSYLNRACGGGGLSQPCPQEAQGRVLEHGGERPLDLPLSWTHQPCLSGGWGTAGGSGVGG